MAFDIATFSMCTCACINQKYSESIFLYCMKACIIMFVVISELSECIPFVMAILHISTSLLLKSAKNLMPKFSILILCEFRILREH